MVFVRVVTQGCRGEGGDSWLMTLMCTSRWSRAFPCICAATMKLRPSPFNCCVLSQMKAVFNRGNNFDGPPVCRTSAVTFLPTVVRWPSTAPFTPLPSIQQPPKQQSPSLNPSGQSYIENRRRRLLQSRGPLGFGWGWCSTGRARYAQQEVLPAASHPTVLPRGTVQHIATWKQGIKFVE